MQFDLTFFAIALPAAFIAGVSKGGFGSGPAFVATAILAIYLTPAVALGIMLPLLLVGDVLTLKPYWRQWDWPRSKVLIIGGAGGVILGALVYRAANQDVLRILIGVISLAFVIYQLTKNRLTPELVPFRPAPGILAGLVSGFTSFVSHAGGPPSAMYLLSQGLGKTTFQATSVIVFFAINAMKAVPYASFGVFTADTMWAGLYMLPALVLGILVGIYAHRALPERTFFAITYALLLGAGLKLIFDGIT